MTLNATLIKTLTDIVGGDGLNTDEAACKLFSQDVFKASEHTVGAVIAPANTDELARVVHETTKAGVAIFPRGGGMSYTGGYLPTRDNAICIDMGRMNKVLDINEEDMTVTVEAGCRWVDMHKALEGTGLRGAFWGTLSGIHATVGGGLSQNCIFFGSAKVGTAADNVVSMDVVTADGTVISTGSAAVKGGAPFQRYYGPDLTGLFTCDTGALGIKATITMKLVHEGKGKEFLSFNFDNYEACLKGMAEVARRGIACEIFGFDPYLQAQRMKRESLAKDVKQLTGVIKQSGSLLGAVKDTVKLGLAGRGFMKDVEYSCHMMFEENTAVAAEIHCNEARDILKAAGGEEIENSIPKLVRANPFTPLNNMIGPDGERWVPVHALIPHSRAVKLMDAIEGLYETHKADIEKYDIGTGYLLATVGGSTTVLEPVFFWPDELLEFQKTYVEDSVIKRIKGGLPKNEAATQFVAFLRGELTRIMMEHGSAHLQIGKAYRYKEGIADENFALVEALKKELDPEGLINPGSLGL